MTGKSDVKIQAEIDKGWTEAKIKNYQEDGSNVPEPVKRLNALAVLVCNAPDAAPVGGADDAAWQKATGVETPDAAHKIADGFVTRGLLLDEWRKATGRDTPALAADMIAKLEGKALLTADMLLMFRDAALWFSKSAAGLSGMSVGAELSQIAAKAHGDAQGAKPGIVATVTVLPAESRVEVSSGPGVTFQDASEGRAAPPVATPAQAPVERKAIAFRPGLVLVKRDAPQHRVLFNNAKGPWTCQTIAANGLLGPETAAHEGTWFADTWEEGPAYVAPAEPKKGEQMTVPGSGPTEPAAPAKKLTVADWTPTDEQIAGYVKSFGDKMAAEEKPVMVDDQLVRGLIRRFKEEKGAMENQKPGVSFFHYGMAALRG